MHLKVSYILYDIYIIKFYFCKYFTDKFILNYGDWFADNVIDIYFEGTTFFLRTAHTTAPNILCTNIWKCHYFQFLLIDNMYYAYTDTDHYLHAIGLCSFRLFFVCLFVYFFMVVWIADELLFWFHCCPVYYCI